MQAEHALPIASRDAGARARCANPLPATPPADRILVVRLGAVGDVVRTLPAASRLREAYPGAHLAWLVEPAAASAVEGQAWIDEVVVFPRARLAGLLSAPRWGRAGRELARFVRQLRRHRFDLVVDFHGILRAGLLSRASGARTRVSYARPYGREGAWWLATHTARVEPPRASRFERNDALVDFLAIDAPPRDEPFQLDPAAVAAMRERLGPGPAPVAIHPGSSDATPYKRWSVARYAELARRLRAEDGVPSVVTRGPARDDAARADAIVDASGGAARPAPPTPALGDLAALFAACRLYVGGDTGPLHVASLVGTPVVQILGNTDPVENAPWTGVPSRSVRHPVACSPCRRGCAAATCLRAVPVAPVLEAARALLARRPAEGDAASVGRAA